MSEEEFLKEIQAAEEAGEHEEDGEAEGEEEQDEVDELDEEETKIYESITKENMKGYLAEATAYKLNSNYEKACRLLKLVILKGETLLGDALHHELATYYYAMGRRESSRELFDGGNRGRR